MLPNCKQSDEKALKISKGNVAKRADTTNSILAECSCNVAKACLTLLPNCQKKKKQLRKSVVKVITMLPNCKQSDEKALKMF